MASVMRVGRLRCGVKALEVCHTRSTAWLEVGYVNSTLKTSVYICGGRFWYLGGTKERPLPLANMSLEVGFCGGLFWYQRWFQKRPPATEVSKLLIE